MVKYYALYYGEDGKLCFVVVDKPNEEEGRDAILRMVDRGNIILHFPESELGDLRNLLENSQTPEKLGLTDPGPEPPVSRETLRRPTTGRTPVVRPRNLKAGHAPIPLYAYSIFCGPRPLA